MSTFYKIGTITSAILAIVCIAMILYYNTPPEKTIRYINMFFMSVFVLYTGTFAVYWFNETGKNETE